MKENGYFERQFEKTKAKYIARHGNTKFLVKTSNEFKKYRACAVLNLISGALFALCVGLSLASRHYVSATLQLFSAASFLGLAVFYFLSLPFYEKKAAEALDEIKKLEAATNGQSADASGDLIPKSL